MRRVGGGYIAFYGIKLAYAKQDNEWTKEI